MQEEKIIDICTVLERYTTQKNYEISDDIRTFFILCKFKDCTGIEFLLSSDEHNTTLYDLFLIAEDGSLLKLPLFTTHIEDFLIDWFESISENFTYDTHGEIHVSINLKHMKIACNLKKEIKTIERLKMKPYNIFKDAKKIKKTFHRFRN
jgi:hypothetical protein